MDGARVRVGLLGCGIVGGSLVELLDEQRDAIAERTGLRLDVVRVAVRNTAKQRAVTFEQVEAQSTANATCFFRF